MSNLRSNATVSGHWSCTYFFSWLIEQNAVSQRPWPPSLKPILLPCSKQPRICPTSQERFFSTVKWNNYSNKRGHSKSSYFELGKNQVSWKKKSLTQDQQISVLEIFLTRVQKKKLFWQRQMCVWEYCSKSWSIQYYYKCCDPRRCKGL